MWGSLCPQPPRSLSAQPFVRASAVTATLQSEQWGPGLSPSLPNQASPPQQEGFREGDKYQMGEGRAARNTLPVCQELLARVGAWAGEGGGARAPGDCSPRSPGPGSQLGTGTAREGPAATRSPLSPWVPGEGNTSLVLEAHTGKVPSCAGAQSYPTPLLGFLPALGGHQPCGGLGTQTPLSSPAPGTALGSSVTQLLRASQSLALPNQPAQGLPGCAAAPAPPDEPAVSRVPPPVPGFLVCSRTAGSSRCLA